jgi:hypothetical protein
MPLNQIISGTLLVAGLLGVGLFFVWRQKLLLRDMQADKELSDEERRHQRRMAQRRMACGVLIVVLAMLLGGAMLFLEGPAQALANQGPDAQPTPEQKSFFKGYVYYWILFLLVLLCLVALAGIDRWATRKYGVEQLRRLRADRRAMLEAQAELLRRGGSEG